MRYRTGEAFANFQVRVLQREALLSIARGVRSGIWGGALCRGSRSERFERAIALDQIAERLKAFDKQTARTLYRALDPELWPIIEDIDSRLKLLRIASVV